MKLLALLKLFFVKKIKNLGALLSSPEMKKIVGGYDGSPSSGPGDPCPLVCFPNNSPCSSGPYNGYCIVTNCTNMLGTLSSTSVCYIPV